MNLHAPSGESRVNDALPTWLRWVSRVFLILLTTPLLLASVKGDSDLERYEIKSPDGRIRVAVEMPGPQAPRNPTWSLAFKGKALFNSCRLGLRSPAEGDFVTGARLLGIERRSMDERIRVPFGRADSARDHFNEIRLKLQTVRQRAVDIVFRCYNDAVAFRYIFPRAEGDSSLTITEEATSFAVVGDPIAAVQYLENFQTSHEHGVERIPASRIRAGALLDLPTTFSWPNGTYAALTEASLRRYAGMSLMRPTNDASGAGFVCRLTPGADGTCVRTSLPLETPWRVAMVAERPGALLESSTLYCLNDPSVIGDTSWIQPGKITFHWWNGDVYDGRPGPPMLSFEMNKKYIDFCVREGIPTHSITSTEGVTTPWYFQSNAGVAPGPDTDVTRLRPGFDLPAIRAYAQSTRVRLWTWVHQAALKGRVEEAFTAFERMGWSGMMVDFFDHDDQEHVEFAESILAAAARHHLLIQLHGIWKPTGLERTYPNLMNHEGALNLEYLKWSDRCTPEHTLNMVFTRMIAGQMDYHLGGFRSVPRSQFVPRQVAPNVMGTRCHHLAMYVCFDNPNPMVADYPAAYEGQPGFEFIKMVPTWWDETRVLLGEVGEVLVTARRKGSIWYLGGLAANRQRDLSVPLSFLGKGSYEGTIWTDAANADQDPNQLHKGSGTYRARQSLRVRVAQGGGFVARLAPKLRAE